ncbi:hypothetical protein UFOVP736_18 [uncultured Caudovirales phage]|uniref:Uncharacterized protein n=1 Tax=uncultured Caudovirales phage TaxID=2100421 RepID=A0A6J5NQ37_9CAUD|nr:hypothetical protein UFOVP705_63 [uncultured Caudovirales phage]CAB5223906.1 hypothetical protein UFOVP736_18 [uncultured Caudovirales phage]
MKLLEHDALDTFCTGMVSVMKYCTGSGIGFLVANAPLPESLEVAKYAGAVTGWVLAIICIWTLAKVARALYDELKSERANHESKMEAKAREHEAKIEEKDKAIADLQAAAIGKSERQREEMLNELKIMNSKK